MVICRISQLDIIITHAFCVCVCFCALFHRWIPTKKQYSMREVHFFVVYNILGGGNAVWYCYITSSPLPHSFFVASVSGYNLNHMMHICQQLPQFFIQARVSCLFCFRLSSISCCYGHKCYDAFLCHIFSISIAWFQTDEQKKIILTAPVITGPHFFVYREKKGSIYCFDTAKIDFFFVFLCTLSQLFAQKNK